MASHPQPLSGTQGAAPWSPRLFSGYFQVTGNRFPPKRLAKTSASLDLAKQNTTKSPPSQRSEYVSGVADRTPAAQNITSRFTGSRRPGASRHAATCGGPSRHRLRGQHLKLRHRKGTGVLRFVFSGARRGRFLPQPANLTKRTRKLRAAAGAYNPKTYSTVACRISLSSGTWG